MTRVGRLLLVLSFAVPAYAQEEPTPEGEPTATEEAAPVEEAPGEAASEEAPAEAAAEEAPTEEAAAEEPAEEDVEPWQLYAGLDLVRSTLSVSGTGAAGSNQFDTGMYRLRFGRRMFESIGIEAQLGFDNGGDGPGEVTTDSYYGVFVVPTATLFEMAELAFPVGYAKSSFARTGYSEDLGSLGYGFNLEVPLRSFGEDNPDLRFCLGWMVYNQKGSARMYGANLGIRYDFTASGFGNPFAGVGEWIGGIDLWPFGDDEPEEESAE